MPTLQPGDKAPAFKLPDQDGKMRSLSEFMGKKLLLYFYLKADTSGCTKQACTVRDSETDLAGLGIAAVGISPDKPEKQKKFDEKYGLGFPLLSDNDHAVAQAYGAWGEKKLYGKSYEGVIRSSFLIDENGKVLHAWYKVNAGDTVTNVQKALSEAPVKAPAKKAPQKAKKIEEWTIFSDTPKSRLEEKGINSAGELVKTLKSLFVGQKLAALATEIDGHPFLNLVAFACSEDMKSLLFATYRETRKFRNISTNSNIAVLIDNRSNEEADFHKATAVTVMGSASVVAETELPVMKRTYLEKHPNLAEFLEAPECALVKVNVEKYVVVPEFSVVVELSPKK